MALTSTGFMAAPGLYGTTGQLDKLDVSDVLAAILLKDTATLGQIAMGSPCKNIEHFYFEDSLHPAYLSCTMSIGTSCDHGHLNQTYISTSASLRLVLRPGTILRSEKFVNHVWRVPDMTLSNTISVVQYGSATVSGSIATGSATLGNAGISATASRYFIVGQPKSDTATYSDDISQPRLRRKNFTQIFERGIQIAETREHIELYAIADEKKHQIKLRTLEMKRELNNAVINSYAYASGSAITPDYGSRTMAGILQLIRDPELDGTNNDTTVTNESWGALSLTKINNLCEKIYNQGGLGDDSNCCIIVGPKQARKLAILEEQRIRKGSRERTVGTFANKVETDLGFELPVVIDRWMPNGTLLILDKNAIKLCSLQGDAWHLEKMAKTGRNQGFQLSGQWTIEMQNSAAKHGFSYQLNF